MPVAVQTLKHPKYPRLKLLLPARSRFWQGVTFIDGRKAQKSLRTRDPETALALGEAWYKRVLRASVAENRAHPLDALTRTPTVGETFAHFRNTLTPTKREYCDMRWGAVAPYWRALMVNKVTAQTFRDFYRYRRQHKTQYGEPPTNSTLHKDIALVRLVLRYAMEEGSLEALPTIPEPGIVVANPRPWLTLQEWTRLELLARQRIQEVANNPRLSGFRSDLHDMMVWMIATCCRVGETLAIRFCDCREDVTKEGEPILIAEVTGKRGTRTIVAPWEALTVYQARSKGREPTDLMFPYHHRDSFRELLKAAHLLKDSRGHARNMKSLRCTAISFRVLHGDDLWLIARNAGTSIEQIDHFYAKRLSAEMGKDVLGRSVSALG